MGKVYFPRRAAWLGDFESELLRFPVGRDDDQVDALALLGRMLGHMTAATIPPKPEPPRWGRTFDELMEAHDRIVGDGSQSRI